MLIATTTRPPLEIDITTRSILRPKTWRAEAYELSYLIVNREVSASDLLCLLSWAVDLQLPNPRVITPDLIQWSSLFHPRFYQSIQVECIPVKPLKWVDSQLPIDFNALSRLWLQSVLFLSGVTLSAAIIQNRFSAGTVGSKLDRLWEAGTLSSSDIAPEIATLDLHNRVFEIAAHHANDITKLFLIRNTFMDVLRLTAPPIGETAIMKKHLPKKHLDGRFDFVEMLRSKFSGHLHAVIVYGSSILSDQFADIDAVLIVDDPTSVLMQLAGTSPTWLSKELNLSVYSPDEFLIMQRHSGDNLMEYGVCIFGQVEIVNKPVANMLARNFSFGMIRQRQQFGMLSRILSETKPTNQDQQNLHEYFVKIPANVAKGTFGAVGDIISKEAVHNWLKKHTGFNTTESQQIAASGNVALPLALSSLTTGKTLAILNKTFNVVH